MVTITTVVSIVRGKSVFTKTGDEVVIMGVETGRYYSLNPVGARFWELIQQPAAIGDAATAITAEFEAPRETIERDLIELTEQLLRARLVECAADAVG